MDAFELLKTDHEKVADLFSKIEGASPQSKMQLFTQLKSDLDLHAHIEETIFYPALENKKESREITLEAYEEHKVVKDLLSELSGGGPADEEWEAKLTVLKENVEHHVDEEEGELFNKARQALSADQIEELGNEMQAEKQRQQGASPTRTAKPNKDGRSQKAQKSPGVLSRLAGLVGLGSAGANKRDQKGSKKSGKKGAAISATKTGGKKSGGKKASKSTKTSKKSGKKAGTKSSKSSRKTVGKKSAVSRATKGRGAAKKRARSR